MLVALLICAVKNKIVDFSCLVYLSTRAVESVLKNLGIRVRCIYKNLKTFIKPGFFQPYF